VAAITLMQLRGYLVLQGWTLVSAPDEYIEVWRINEIGGSELLLPTEAAADKSFLLKEALSKLSQLVGLSVHELTQTIREHSENIVSIRVAHPDVNDGSIPLEDGIALNANAKELLAAAANATIERRALYQGRQPALVASLLQNARLGQTTHGSYVIHVFSKDPSQSEQPANLDFARVTTEMLQSALGGLREAVDTYQSSGNSIAFEEALSRGASANLCDAISKLSGKDRARTVEISLTPNSSGRLSPSPRTTVEFLPSHQSTISAAADYFRRTYTLADENVVGIVERLDRRAEQDSGIVRIAATLSNGVQRSVSLQLSPDAYQEAIHAHENRMMVQVTGSVMVTPRTAHIIEPRGFRVAGNYQLFGS
jgi:hypothetical protein